jgi:hypothetical protein
MSSHTFQGAYEPVNPYLNTTSLLTSSYVHPAFARIVGYIFSNKSVGHFSGFIIFENILQLRICQSFYVYFPLAYEENMCWCFVILHADIT